MSKDLVFGYVGKLKLSDSGEDRGYNVVRELFVDERFDTSLVTEEISLTLPLGKVASQVTPWWLEGDSIVASLPLTKNNRIDGRTLKTLYTLVKDIHLRAKPAGVETMDAELRALDLAIHGLLYIAAWLHKQGKSIGLIDPFNVFVRYDQGTFQGIVLPDVGFSYEGAGDICSWQEATKRWDELPIKPKLLCCLFGDYTLQAHEALVRSNPASYRWEEARMLTRLVYWVLTGKFEREISLEQAMQHKGWEFLYCFIGKDKNSDPQGKVQPLSVMKTRLQQYLKGMHKYDDQQLQAALSAPVPVLLQESSRAGLASTFLNSPIAEKQVPAAIHGGKVRRPVKRWAWIGAMLVLIGLGVVGSFIFVQKPPEIPPPPIMSLCSDCGDDSPLYSKLAEMRPAFDEYEESIQKHIFNNEYIKNPGQEQMEFLYTKLENQQTHIDEAKSAARKDSKEDRECVETLQTRFSSNLDEQWKLLRQQREYVDAPTRLLEFHEKQLGLAEAIVKEGGKEPSWLADCQYRYGYIKNNLTSKSSDK